MFGDLPAKAPKLQNCLLQLELTLVRYSRGYGRETLANRQVNDLLHKACFKRLLPPKERLTVEADVA